MTSKHAIDPTAFLISLRFRVPAVLAAVLSLNIVYAQEAVRVEEGSINVGIGLVSGSESDRAQFGQHNSQIGRAHV